MQDNFLKFFNTLEDHQIALFLAGKRVAARLHGVRESDGWQNHFFWYSPTRCAAPAAAEIISQRHRDTEEVWQNGGQQNHFLGTGGVMVDSGSGGRTSLHTAETAMPLFCDKKSNFKATLVLYQKLAFGLLNVARASHFPRRRLQAGSLHG